MIMIIVIIINVKCIPSASRCAKHHCEIVVAARASAEKNTRYKLVRDPQVFQSACVRMCVVRLETVIYTLARIICKYATFPRGVIPRPRGGRIGRTSYLLLLLLGFFLFSFQRQFYSYNLHMTNIYNEQIG